MPNPADGGGWDSKMAKSLVALIIGTFHTLPEKLPTQMTVDIIKLICFQSTGLSAIVVSDPPIKAN